MAEKVGGRMDGQCMGWLVDGYMDVLKGGHVD